MPGFTVVYDACVLYPFILRDLLVELALTDLFNARWSQRIHDEWMRNVQKDYPDISLTKLRDIADLMDRHALDAVVEDWQAYEKMVDEAINPQDRHVVATALACKADVIVTYNLKDFPDAILRPYGLQAEHPDEFLCNQMGVCGDKSLIRVLDAVKTCIKRRRNPTITTEKYLQRLVNIQLELTADRLYPFLCP